MTPGTWDYSAEFAEEQCSFACQQVRDWYGGGTENLCERCGDKLFDHFRFSDHACTPACSVEVRLDRLEHACDTGRLEEAKRWVAEYPALRIQNKLWFDDMAYRAAAIHGHLHVLQWAVAEHGVDLTANYFQQNLHWCRYRHVMQWAVEHGVRMDSRLRDTCLLSACGRPDGLGTAQWLCAQGADPHGAPFRQAAMCQVHIALWMVQREPEYPWPRHLLKLVMVRCWRPARDAWMRSVTDVGRAL